MISYKVFRRAARSFREFASARKHTIAIVASVTEAQRICTQKNRDLTPAQQARGVKYEFTRIGK